MQFYLFLVPFHSTMVLTFDSLCPAVQEMHRFMGPDAWKKKMKRNLIYIYNVRGSGWRVGLEGGGGSGILLSVKNLAHYSFSLTFLLIL